MDIPDEASVARNGAGRVVLRFQSYMHGNLVDTQELGLHNTDAVSRLEDACADSRGRYLLFGGGRTGATDVVIAASRPRWSMVDEFLTYDPVRSPDGRWIVYRKFYPATAARNVSEEYRIYDLSKSRDKNRSHDAEGNVVAGSLIYPFDQRPQSAPSENARAAKGAEREKETEFLSQAQQHRFGSYSFYWSDDSRSLVFADSQFTKPVIVLLTLNGEILRTYTRTMSEADIACQGPRFLRAARVDERLVTVAVCSRIRDLRRNEFVSVEPAKAQKPQTRAK
ncbi:MAG: hypothetical protein LAQ30_22875 [Acidobacteriia bacterium]|nr:hypothetical protein [Terriglobia bacterium]